MTDRSADIEHFHQTKDDESEWGEPVRPTSRRRLDAIVSVRFDATELESIREASPDGNVSHFIRMATLKAAADDDGFWISDSQNRTSASLGTELDIVDTGTATTSASGFVTNDLPASMTRLRPSSSTSK
jgi:hypothetical protein